MGQSILQLLSYLVGEVTISAKHLAESSELEVIVEDTGPQPEQLVLTVVSDCDLKISTTSLCTQLF